MSAVAPGRVVLRDPRWTDVPALADLEAALFPDDAWSQASWWAELAARPRRDYVVADAAGRLLGYGGVDHGGEVADVMTVAVDAAARGGGLGRSILAELERRAAARGAAHVMLEVRADNPAALGLYGHAGYAVVSRRRGYYQPGSVDAFVMRRALSPNGAADG